MVTTFRRTVPLVGIVTLALLAESPPQQCRAEEIPFSIAKIYWEYNASANDLGVHVSLDAEDWRRLKIVKPNDRPLFEVEGHGPYRELGMTELFFEGAEPSLDEFPLAELLARFPEGEYEIEGRTVDGSELGERGDVLPRHPRRARGLRRGRPRRTPSSSAGPR